MNMRSSETLVIQTIAEKQEDGSGEALKTRVEMYFMEKNGYQSWVLLNKFFFLDFWWGFLPLFYLKSLYWTIHVVSGLPKQQISLRVGTEKRLIGALPSVSILILCVRLSFLLFWSAAAFCFGLVDGTSGTTVHVSLQLGWEVTIMLKPLMAPLLHLLANAITVSSASSLSHTLTFCEVRYSGKWDEKVFLIPGLPGPFLCPLLGIISSVVLQPFSYPLVCPFLYQSNKFGVPLFLSPCGSPFLEKLLLCKWTLCWCNTCCFFQYFSFPIKLAHLHECG